MEKVAIIGNGTVGSSLARAMGIKAIGPGDSTVEAKVVILCVPTETVDGVHDQSQVKQAFSRVKAKLIVVRSTVLPGTTDELQKLTKTPVCFVPEFGFENTMYQDMKHPKMYVVGTTKQSFQKWYMAEEILPPCDEWQPMDAISAEFVKYFCNIWGCSQVILANSLYDWVRSQTKDKVWSQIIDGLRVHPNIPQWGWNVFHDNFRGYAGKCLPKDIQAAISQFPHPLWLMIERLNQDLKNE
jgi:UDP-glucose 6-dehydrogenase